MGVARNAGGGLEVFARGTDDRLWHSYGWSQWASRRIAVLGRCSLWEAHYYDGYRDTAKGNVG